MSKRKDFDIVDDDEEVMSERRPAWWWWLGGSVLLIVLAGVFALATFTQRVSSPSPTNVAVAAPTPVTTVAGGVAVAPAEPTATVSPEITPTPAPSPTPEETPTPIPEPSPTPCSVSVATEFFARYDLNQLGCPLAPAQIVWSAWQPFQGGQMYWRRDTDQAFLLSNAGIYSPVIDRWDGGASPNRGSAPPGLYAPERGFGAVWARSDEIFNVLGWATAPERGFCARIQDFDYGSMVVGDPVSNCTPENLYNHAAAGDWPPVFFRFTEAGTWQ